jgi:cytoskeleton protein RodZ
MSSLGENLRRERELRDIPLAEIAAATKINSRFLEAIERDDFDSLPGGIFARSFVRSYAAYLGLDPEPVLAEYQLLAPHDKTAELPRGAAIPRLGGREKSTTVVPLLIAIVLLAGGYSLYRYSHRLGATIAPVDVGQRAESPHDTTGALAAPPSLPPPLSAPLNQATSPAESEPKEVPSEPGAPAQSSADASAATGPVVTPSDNPGHSNESAAINPSASGNSASITDSPSGSPLPAPASPGRLTLELAAIQPCWVSVQSDGKLVLQVTLQANESKVVSAVQWFQIVAGNVQGLALTLNGHRLSPMTGSVKKFKLTEAGVTSAPIQAGP